MSATRSVAALSAVAAVVLAALIGIELLTRERRNLHATEREARRYAVLLPAEARIDSGPSLTLILGGNALPLRRVRVGTEVVGYVAEVDSARGYGGRIRFAVAADLHGTSLGVVALEHSETPGLGDFIAKASGWMAQFRGRDGTTRHALAPAGDYAAIAGATITASATLSAAGPLLTCIARHAQVLAGATPPTVVDCAAGQ